MYYCTPPTDFCGTKCQNHKNRPQERNRTSRTVRLSAAEGYILRDSSLNLLKIYIVLCSTAHTSRPRLGRREPNATTARASALEPPRALGRRAARHHKQSKLTTGTAVNPFPDPGISHGRPLARRELGTVRTAWRGRGGSPGDVRWCPGFARASCPSAMLKVMGGYHYFSTLIGHGVPHCRKRSLGTSSR